MATAVVERVIARMGENSNKVRKSVRAPMARATAANAEKIRVRQRVVIIITGANQVGMFHTRYLNRR